jgi:tetratricopeptide (TPR) repeat protein
MSKPLVSLALCSFLAAFPARAARPWEPNVSVPHSAEGSTAKKPLDEQKQKRFDADLTRGRTQLALGRYQQAREALSEAILLDPDHLEARILRARASLTLGYLNWNRGTVEEAADDVRHALVLDPLLPELKNLDHLLQGLQKRMGPAPAAVAPKRSSAKGH